VSSRLHAAQFAEAIVALEFAVGWWGGHMHVELGDGREFVHRCGIPGSGRRLAESVRFHDEHADVEIRLGLPWTRHRAGGVGQVSVLWCRVEGSKQLEWARRFRPLPAIVLQEGSSSRRLLFWPLEAVVPWTVSTAANRRLAYKFGATQKWADADLLRVPAPGSCLREGRDRPLPIRVARLTTASFRPEQFAASRWLKDPPEPFDWMKGEGRGDGNRRAGRAAS
jgi:hypothetical protein